LPVIVANEDEVKAAIALIESSATIEELKANYFPMGDQFKSDPEASTRLAAAKNKRKGELA